MNRRLAVPCALLVALTVAANAAPPVAPPNPTIQAAATNEEFQLRVTWTDFVDEDFYQLLASNSSTPGPIVGPNSTIWEVVATLNANTTEYVDETMFSQSYGICAYKNSGEMTCVAPSNHARPKLPPEPASVDELTVHNRRTNSLSVSWIQSPNTRQSRVELLSSNSVIAQVPNDPDQNVTFASLSPNSAFQVRVCVRNEEQTAADETCRSTTTSTLPLAPLAVNALSVNLSDPSPTSRTVSFAYDNQQSSAVVGLNVRLIKDDALLSQTTLYPPSGSPYGNRNYTHTFTNLTPFTGYEVWVAPYNRSGVGTSSGVGFTTPTSLAPTLAPVSADSAVLAWLENAPGEYAIEKRLNSGTWQTVCSYRNFGRPALRRSVIEQINSAQVLRVTWKLAYLRAESNQMTLTVLAAGTPEVIRISGRSVYVPGSTAFGTRDAVSFRTTTAGGEYQLQQRISTTDPWVKLSSAASVLTSPTTANTVYVLHHTFLGRRPSYRVCRNPPPTKGARSISELVMRCSGSEPSNYSGTAELPRYDVD